MIAADKIAEGRGKNSFYTLEQQIPGLPFYLQHGLISAVRFGPFFSERRFMLSASHFEVSGIKEGLQVFLRTIHKPSLPIQSEYHLPHPA